MFACFMILSGLIPGQHPSCPPALPWLSAVAFHFSQSRHLNQREGQTCSFCTISHQSHSSLFLAGVVVVWSPSPCFGPRPTPCQLPWVLCCSFRFDLFLTGFEMTPAGFASGSRWSIFFAVHVLLLFWFSYHIKVWSGIVPKWL